MNGLDITMVYPKPTCCHIRSKVDYMYHIHNSTVYEHT